MESIQSGHGEVRNKVFHVEDRTFITSVLSSCINHMHVTS